MNYLKSMNIFLFFIALLISIGCADSDQIGKAMTSQDSGDQVHQDANSDPHSVGGKLDDIFQAERTRYATCNGGALIVDRIDDEYVAIVTDSGVVNYFIDQSESVFQTTVEYSGQSNRVSIQKRFPWMVTINDTEEGSPQLVIRDFRLDKETESLITSGAPGNTISHLNGGLKLVINGADMTSSHTISYYEVGHWFFESCQLEVHSVSAESDDLVADCNDGALTVERSTERENGLVAVIADEEVVDYFLAQSAETYCEEVSYSGETRNVCMEKRFPYSVAITEDGSLLIENLQAHHDTFAISGRDGARFDYEGEGLRLTLYGSEVTSSHTVSYYEIGDWLFETCAFY